MKAGIYCIKVNECIVYVGKSKNLQGRMFQHWGKIFSGTEDNKYKLLHSAFNHYYRITFWVLGEYEEAKLNEKEKMWIEILKPCLNGKMNNNRGLDITAQEFYDEIHTRSDYVEGMY